MEQLPLIPNDSQGQQEKRVLGVDAPLRTKRLHEAVEAFLASKIGPRKMDAKSRKETAYQLTPRDISRIYASLLREEDDIRNQKKLSVKDAEHMHVTEDMIREHLRKLGEKVPLSEKEKRQAYVMRSTNVSSKARISPQRTSPKKEHPHPKNKDLF